MTTRSHRPRAIRLAICVVLAALLDLSTRRRMGCDWGQCTYWQGFPIQHTHTYLPTWHLYLLNLIILTGVALALSAAFGALLARLRERR